MKNEIILLLQTSAKFYKFCKGALEISWAAPHPIIMSAANHAKAPHPRNGAIAFFIEEPALYAPYADQAILAAAPTLTPKVEASNAEFVMNKNINTNTGAIKLNCLF